MALTNGIVYSFFSYFKQKTKLGVNLRVMKLHQCNILGIPKLGYQILWRDTKTLCPVFPVDTKKYFEFKT